MPKQRPSRKSGTVAAASVRYDGLCEYVDKPPRVRLRNDETGLLSWYGEHVMWRTTANKHFVYLRPKGQSVEDGVWAAAERALYEGGWLYAIHLDTKLLPPDCVWLRKERTRHRAKQTPDVIPVGAGTSLISIEGISSVFYCSHRTALRWIQSLEVPTIQAPGGKSYVSLWVLELGILKFLWPEMTWHELASQLKNAQSVYGAARRNAALQRLRSLAKSIKPNSVLLRRKKPRAPSPPK